MDGMAKVFWLSLERSDSFIGYFGKGLEGDDWFARPDGVPNPAIWTLGHMAYHRALLLEMLTGERSCPDHWRELFTMGCRPLDDPRGYPGVGECRVVLDSTLSRLRAYLATATDAELDTAPLVESRFLKSKVNVLVHLTHHKAHHTGSLNLLRRLLGKEKVI